MGDQILAMFHLVGCFWGIVILIYLGLLSLGYSFTSVANDFQLVVPSGFSFKGPLVDFFKNSTKQLSGSTLAIALSIFSILMAIATIIYIVATWKSRKWALWTTFLIQVPGVSIAIWFYTTSWIIPDPFSIIGFIVLIYSGLRITGVVGPKL